MMLPADLIKRSAMNSALLIFAVSGAGAALAQTSVPQAMRLQLGEMDLTNVTRALGSELAGKEISGRIPVTYGTLSFSRIEARDVTFKATVKGLESTARDGYLIGDIHVSRLEVRIGSLMFAADPRAQCRGFHVSLASTRPLTARFQMAAERDTVRIHASDSSFLVPGDQFRGVRPVGCDVSWQTATLVGSLGPWAAQTFKQHILEHVVTELNRGIGGHLSHAATGLVTTILLPWQSEGRQALIASSELRPRQALVRRPRPNHAPLTVDLASVITVRAGAYAPKQRGGLLGQNLTAEAAAQSWLGISRSYLAGVITEAVRKDLLSATINKHTAPHLRSVLLARQLARFVPDAATRFEGHEDVELRLGKAGAVSVIIKPQGPGGIPIIDAYLSQVPIEVLVNGKAYVQARTDVHFRYKARIDQAAGMIVFDLEDSDSKTAGIGFNPTLMPKPSDRSVSTGDFNQWVSSFTTGQCFEKDGIEAITVTLPRMQIGNRSVSWSHAIEVDGDYLTTGMTVR